MQRADQRNVDWISRQPIACRGEARHTLALQNLEAHAYCVRQNDICPDPISEAQGENQGEAAVHDLEDEHDQPNAEDAQAKDQQTLYQAYKTSHDLTVKPLA